MAKKHHKHANHLAVEFARLAKKEDGIKIPKHLIEELALLISSALSTLEYQTAKKINSKLKALRAEIKKEFEGKNEGH